MRDKRANKISGEFTLKITEAEVLESQLTPEDLEILKADVGVSGGTLCPEEYCKKGYAKEEVDDFAAK